MTTYRRTYGLWIEGFGDAGLHVLGKNIRIGLQAFEPDGSTIYLSGMATLPKKISTECDVLRGHTTQSTMDFNFQGLDLSDVSFVRYSRALLSFFWRARPRHVARLSAAIDTGDTTFDVAMVVGASTILAGDVLYIGREVLYVTAASGTDPRTITVTRGVLGSTAAPHEMDDNFVYIHNPAKIGRKLVLYEYNFDTLAENPRWRGIVEGFDLSDRTTLLRVAGRDLLSTLSEYKLGRQRWEGVLAVARMPYSTDASQAAPTCQVRQNSPVVNYLPVYPQVQAGYFPGSTGWPSDMKAMAVEIDGVMASVRMGIATEGQPAPLFAAAWSVPIHGGFLREGDDGQRVDADNQFEEVTAREIIVGDADNDLCYFRDLSDTVNDHPAVIALNILESTGGVRWGNTASPSIGPNGNYDWLPGPWGLKVPSSWVSEASFEALTSGYPSESLRGRSFYLGAGEDLPQGMDTIADLMQAQCGYIYVDSIGRICGRRLADPGSGYCDRVIDVSDILWMKSEGDEQGMRMEKPVYSIALETCPQGPGGDPAHIVDGRTIGQVGLVRFDGFGVQDKLTSTRIYGDPKTHELSGDETDILAALFLWRYIFTQDVLPRYKLCLRIGASLCMPGEWIELTHPYFFGSELERGFSAHRCLVLEQDWDIETGKQELTVVDFSPLTGADSLLSPAWRVASVVDSQEFTIETDWYSAGGDEDLLEVGNTYKLELWSEDGQLKSVDGPQYLASRTGVTCVLDQPWQDTAVDVVPVVGDVVRLAAWTDRGDWEDENYTWMGNTNGQVGGSVDNAERWDV